MTDHAAKASPFGLALAFCFIRSSPEPKRAKTRVHLDLVNPDPSAASELIRLGATVTGKHKIASQHWTVMQDPEGSEFCIAAKSFTGWD